MHDRSCINLMRRAIHRRWTEGFDAASFAELANKMLDEALQSEHARTRIAATKLLIEMHKIDCELDLRADAEEEGTGITYEGVISQALEGPVDNPADPDA